MKIRLFIAACLVVVSCGCGKNPLLAPGSSISATIDGVPRQFNFIDSVGYSNTGNWYSMSVSGKSSMADTADVLQLTVFSKTPVTASSYAFVPAAQQPQTTLLVVYLPKGSHNLADDYVVDYTGARPVGIDISTLTKTRVQGTFSGTLIVAAGSAGTTRTFTDGKFDLGAK